MIWAPDVVDLGAGTNAAWRFYVSYVNSAHDSAIAAYRGESATGSFTFAGILTDANGRDWMYYHWPPWPSRPRTILLPPRGLNP